MWEGMGGGEASQPWLQPPSHWLLVHCCPLLRCAHGFTGLVWFGRPGSLRHTLGTMVCLPAAWALPAWLQFCTPGSLRAYSVLLTCPLPSLLVRDDNMVILHDTAKGGCAALRRHDLHYQ